MFIFHLVKYLVSDLVIILFFPRTPPFLCVQICFALFPSVVCSVQLSCLVAALFACLLCCSFVIIYHLRVLPICLWVVDCYCIMLSYTVTRVLFTYWTSFTLLGNKYISSGAKFTKYLTIYRKFIVRSTYDSDLKSAKISFRNIVS